MSNSQNVTGGSAGLAARIAAARNDNTSSQPSSRAAPAAPASVPPAPTRPTTTTPAAALSASAAASGTPKCPICSKSVYKMEEIVALNHTWHKSCFTCGATQSDGCGRTLNREGYLDHCGAPYCNPCYGRLFRPKGVGFGANLSTDTGKPESTSPPQVSSVGSNITQVDNASTNRRPSLGGGSAALAARLASTQLESDQPSQPPPPPPANKATTTTTTTTSTTTRPVVAAAAPAPAPAAPPARPTTTTPAAASAAASGTPKCPICSKSVYKMEEIVALNHTWHKSCFTCGATQSDGCGRTLNREGYLDHCGAPYCNPCYGRLFRPKGVGFGTSMNTDSGQSPSTVDSVPSKPAVTSTTNRSTGANTKYVSNYVPTSTSEGGEVDESEW